MVTFGQNTDLNARTLAITTDAYLDKVVKNVMGESPIMAAMQKKGRISRRLGGVQETRVVQYRRQDLTTLNIDMGSVTYSRLNRWVNVAMPPRAYFMQDAVSIQEEFINTGEPNKVALQGEMMARLTDDFVYQFPAEFFKDGNAAGNTERIHGWESCLSYSGTLYNGRLGSPNDSYLGQSTAVGLRGSWTANNNFPNGSGEVGYHYWTPFVWLYDDASWTGSTATWEDACLRLATQDQLFSKRRGHKRDLGFLNTTAYAGMKNKIEAREQIRTERGSGTELLVSLGLGPVIYYEGVEWTEDRNVPSRDPLAPTTRILAGYTLTLKDLELKHWTPKLFHRLDIPFQGNNLTQPFALLSMCNLFTNPQGVSKIVNTGTTDSTME